MLALILFFLIASVGLNIVTLVILHSHLPVWQSICNSLRVWDNPEHFAQPLPEPGTAWVPSDHELAMREQQMLTASEGRVNRIGRPVIQPSGSGRLRRVSPVTVG